MKATIKVAGLSLLAVLVLGVVGASTASAKFDSEAASTTVAGVMESVFEHKFTMEAGTTSCEVASFHSMSAATTKGPVTGSAVSGGFTSETLTIQPIYGSIIDGSCSNNLLGRMLVKINDCDYRFTAGETIEAGTRVKGEMKIVCHAGGKIEIIRVEGVPCTITIGEQELGGVTYHNKETGSSRDVTVELSITKIAYTQDGMFCPGNGGAASKSFTNGTYSGKVTLKGENTATKAQTGIWVT